MAIATGTLISAGIAAGGLALSTVGKVIGTSKVADQIRFTERYKQALNVLQRSALRQSYGLQIRTSIMQENTNLAKASVFASKGRIGLAGVSSPLTTYISQNHDLQRQQFFQQHAERLAKLAVADHSSKIAAEEAFDTKGLIAATATSALKTAGSVLEILDEG